MRVRANKDHQRASFSFSYPPQPKQRRGLEQRGPWTGWSGRSKRTSGWTHRTWNKNILIWSIQLLPLIRKWRHQREQVIGVQIYTCHEVWLSTSVDIGSCSCAVEHCLRPEKTESGTGSIVWLKNLKLFKHVQGRGLFNRLRRFYFLHVVPHTQGTLHETPCK